MSLSSHLSFVFFTEHYLLCGQRSDIGGSISSCANDKGTQRMVEGGRDVDLGSLANRKRPHLVSRTLPPTLMSPSMDEVYRGGSS